MRINSSNWIRVSERVIMASAVVVNIMTSDREISAEGQDPWTELLMQVRDHADQQAFARLFEHFAPLIKSFALNSGGLSSNALAEDLVQQVMIKIWNRASTYRPERASATTWVYTLARNARIDLLRRQRHEYGAVDVDELWDLADEETATPEQQLDSRQTRKRVQESLVELPSEQRQIVAMVFLEGKTHSEVSKELQLPLGTVKSRIRLAMSKLKIILDR